MLTLPIINILAPIKRSMSPIKEYGNTYNAYAENIDNQNFYAEYCGK